MPWEKQAKKPLGCVCVCAWWRTVTAQVNKQACQCNNERMSFVSFCFVIQRMNVVLVLVLVRIYKYEYVCSLDFEMIVDYIRFLKLSKFVIGHFDKLVAHARAQTHTRTQCALRILFSFFSFLTFIHSFMYCLSACFFLIHRSRTFQADVNHSSYNPISMKCGVWMIRVLQWISLHSIEYSNFIEFYHSE